MKKRTKWVPKVVTKWMSFEEAQKRHEVERRRRAKKRKLIAQKRANKERVRQKKRNADFGRI